MRLKIILTLSAIAGLILVWNLRRIFLDVPAVLSNYVAGNRIHSTVYDLWM